MIAPRFATPDDPEASRLLEQLGLHGGMTPLEARAVGWYAFTVLAAEREPSTLGAECLEYVANVWAECFADLPASWLTATIREASARALLDDALEYMRPRWLWLLRDVDKPKAEPSAEVATTV